MNKILLGFIMAVMCVTVAAGLQASPSVKALAAAESIQSEVPQMSMSSQLVVYYFHGNARCPSCYKLEQYAKESVEQNFFEEIKAGKIVFKKINIDQPANSHFVNDYQLYTKAVVVSLVKEGKQVKYKNLEQVWNLLRDRNKYHEYIRDEIKPFLGEL